jgi:hypothetical protein
MGVGDAASPAHRFVDARAVGLKQRSTGRARPALAATSTDRTEGEETMATKTAQGSSASGGSKSAPNYKDLMKEQFKVDATWLSGFAIAIVVATLVMAAAGVPAGWVAAIAVFLSALVLMGAVNHKLSQLIVAVQQQR